MKKRMLTAMMVGVLSTSLVVPAMAGSSGEAVPTTPGTDVFAGIMLEDPDARIKVEVPTLFAFVVNGSVAGDADVGLSSQGEDATIMLPNVKVKVNKPSGTFGTAAGESKISIEVEGESTLKFTNYSTVKAAGVDTSREGLPVRVSGSIKNEGTDASRNYWTHVGAAKTNDVNTFKQYTLSVDGKPFSKAADGGFAMAAVLSIPAPDLGKTGTGDTATYSNMDVDTKLAVSGVQTEAKFDVTVGGKRNQYKQVEESAKVGSIVWTIGAEITGNGIYTAPDGEYLDGVVTGGNAADPDSIPTVAAP